MTRPKVLLLDDSVAFAESLQRGLRTAVDFKVAETIEDAKSALDDTTELAFVDVVLSEASPGDRSGLAFLEWAVQHRPDVPVIVLTGHGEDDLEVEALRLGAADYIEKENLSFKLLRAKLLALLGRRRERVQNIELKSRLAEYEPHVLVGESRAMTALRLMIQQLATSAATVFITGESGVGKEVVARALHQAGPRRDRPFIPVNCAALSAGLLESELFGHEKGAFTGAHERRVGMFEKADGGVLLLDEITEIDTNLQAKLLRALQEKQIQRVGNSTAVAVDVRIIATTNRDPEASVRDGKLREDLFYRLNVLRIDVPPLRQRLDDIPLLVQHFLGKQRRRVAAAVDRFSDAGIGLLKSYSWPGNVRELENIVERACTLCRGHEVPPDLVSPWLRQSSTLTPQLLDDSDLDIEKRGAFAQIQALASALERCHGNKQEAQKILRIVDRSTMRRTALRLLRTHPNLCEKFPIITSSYGNKRVSKSGAQSKQTAGGR